MFFPNAYTRNVVVHISRRVHFTFLRDRVFTVFLTRGKQLRLSTCTRF